MECFSIRLKELRLEKNLSQRQLAKKLDVSHTAIARWELGTRLPDIDYLYKIAEFFGVSSDYLIGLSEE